MQNTAERWAEINLDAVRHNVLAIRSLIGERSLIAVVKADAYGHGAVDVAKAAYEAGADYLGVVHVSEALELRQAGISAPIISWLHTPFTDFEAALRNNIQLGASGWDLKMIADAALATGHKARVHLKVDTGLGRNGSTMEQWPEFVRYAAELEMIGVIEVVGIFSHLAVADEPKRTETDDQIDVFVQACEIAEKAGLKPAVKHIANSPATLNALNTVDPDGVLCNGVRVGLAIYGLSPFEDKTPEDLGLRPVMTVGTYVNNVKEVPAGQGVSYGLRYHTDKPTTLALVPVGYADGVPRIAEDAPVRIYPRGAEAKTYKVVGRIAMDQMVVDLGEAGLSDDEYGFLGAHAVLFGEGENPPVKDWADAAGTINYEIVTRISPRITRVAVRDDAESAEDTESAESAKVADE